ncbi:MAG: YiiD C-terminal domain-containing protein [Candidatus Protochlamydia sp.]|nr:YiiD C-terminal domain-containing protein [Candidatus Protochlamydia sp.]
MKSNTPEKSLENYLRENIPISAAMNIGVDLASSKEIILSAPISININHKRTVFGGSLHAVATLACWSLLHVNFQTLKENFQIVITKSETSYLAPVATDFKAECTLPNPSDWELFIYRLQKKGKARIKLSAQIFQYDQLCVDYSGTFAAIKIIN